MSVILEKYQATGNDFILSTLPPANPSDFAKMVCDRHFGIGADGILFPEASSNADITMRYYNADGSEAPMCGNGLRAFVKFVRAHNLVKSPSFSVETRGGLMRVCDDGENVQLEFPNPTPYTPYDETQLPSRVDLRLEGQTLTLYLLRTGTDHAVLFTEDKSFIDRVGQTLSTHAQFKEGMNVNFVQVNDENTLSVETFERGAGKTLSCGTGVLASAYVAHHVLKTASKLTVHVPGGTLKVDLTQGFRLEGPAKKVASLRLEEAVLWHTSR